jgi:large subunit ribosomal protein L25
MTDIILSAKKRISLGKGPARRLRMNDELPAVLYAQGKDALPLIINPRETTKILKGPLRRNVVIKLNVENGLSTNVMVKERQIHPTRRNLTHVDFVEINLNKEVVVSVPVILSGKSESVTLGGKLDHVLSKMKISCLPTRIPEAINVDISPLGFGSTHAENIALPEGLRCAEKPRVVVLTIKKPRGAAKEEEATKEAAKPAAKAKK